MVGDNHPIFIHDDATSRALRDPSCSHAQHAEPGIALVRDDGRRLDVDHGIDGGFRRIDKRVAFRGNLLAGGVGQLGEAPGVVCMARCATTGESSLMFENIEVPAAPSRVHPTATAAMPIRL